MYRDEPVCMGIRKPKQSSIILLLFFSKRFVACFPMARPLLHWKHELLPSFAATTTTDKAICVIPNNPRLPLHFIGGVRAVWWVSQKLRTVAIMFFFFSTRLFVSLYRNACGFHFAQYTYCSRVKCSNFFIGTPQYSHRWFSWSYKGSFKQEALEAGFRNTRSQLAIYTHGVCSSGYVSVYKAVSC